MRQAGGGFAALVAGVLLLSACGATKTVTAPPPAASTSPETTTSSSSEVTSPGSNEPTCESLITSAHGVGTCSSGPYQVKYAAPGHHLVLSGLTAVYVSKHTESSIAPKVGESLKAHGTFLIVTLSITNTEHSPEEWNSSKTSLILGGNHYEEAFEAENGPDEQSFLWQVSKSKLQPEETREGDVVFDIPTSATATLLNEGGGVAIKDFGEEKGPEEQYGGILFLPKGE
jgi:Domain of unknown function (DUF4352)